MADREPADRGEAPLQLWALRFARQLGLAAVAALGLALEPAAAETPVELELVLAIDTSSSVDTREFSLQVGGYAAAFREPLA